MTISDIRHQLAAKFEKNDFVVSENGTRTVEIIGASFIADGPIIFGVPDDEYVKREIKWYMSQSLYVKDLGDPVPKIWQRVASSEGKINSNYGYLLVSNENGLQYDNVIKHLLEDRETRRAVAIYTRPTMHSDYNTNGMSDFVCTNAVQYVIRNGALQTIVQMRSNDAWSGYKNDYMWQKYISTAIVADYNDDAKIPIVLGNITWQVGSLHIYEPQFYLLQSFLKNGKFEISHKEWKEQQ